MIDGVIICSIIVLVIVVAQLAKEGFFRRNSRRYVEKLRDQGFQVAGMASPCQIVIPCQKGLYPPVASLLLFDVASRGRVLFVSKSGAALYERALDLPILERLVLRASVIEIRIINLRGLYGRIELGHEKLWVERRWFSQVRNMANLDQNAS